LPALRIRRESRARTRTLGPVALLVALAFPLAGDAVAEEAAAVAESSAATVRVPELDCEATTEVGYRRGRRIDVTVVTIDDDRVERATASAYWAMREAAAKDGIPLTIFSGFRSALEQAYFYQCYRCCCCNGCAQAAKPGFSNHQSGRALDIDTAPPGVHAWLVEHAGEFGFQATVSDEPWHWEYRGRPRWPSICKSAPR
jgi:D-alanyl-D-alanine carboxypeptidase